MRNSEALAVVRVGDGMQQYFASKDLLATIQKDFL
jgi:hypothetical protein